MGWVDSMKRALDAKGMSLDQGRMLVHHKS